MSHENTPLIILDYTPKSHVLCWEALKDSRSDFRINILRPAEWATWHPKLKVPGGKGWCIRKENFDDLVKHFRDMEIAWSVKVHVCPALQAGVKGSRGAPKKKGTPTAYSFFTKEMWSDRDFLKTVWVDGEAHIKNVGNVATAIAKKWKEVNVGHTKWHDMAQKEKLKTVAPTPQSDTKIEPTSVQKWEQWVSEGPDREFEWELLGDYYRVVVHPGGSVDGVKSLLNNSIVLTFPRPADVGDLKEYAHKEAWEIYFGQK